MKPPQKRKTPVRLDNWTRVIGSDRGVSIQSRYEGETKFTRAVPIEGREQVEELRDVLNAWLEEDDG